MFYVFRGHGTQVVDGILMATVCGVIQRVNKLISVVPVKNRYATSTLLLQFLETDKSNSTSGMARAPHRYNPELGDVVVGRVTEVSSPILTV